MPTCYGYNIVGVWVPAAQVKTFMEITGSTDVTEYDKSYSDGGIRQHTYDELSIDLSDAAVAALTGFRLERGSSSRCDLSTWQEDGGMWLSPNDVPLDGLKWTDGEMVWPTPPTLDPRVSALFGFPAPPSLTIEAIGATS